MSGSHRPRRRPLPAVLLLVAAGGLAGLGLRVVTSERAVAERTARERLASRARQGVGLLVAAAAGLARRAALGEPDAIAGPDGTFLRPAPPRAFPPLRFPPERDPEAAFYLASGARAEVADGDTERAAGLYRAAAGEGRDPAARRIALYRLAALHRRTKEEGTARKEEAAFLALLGPGDRRTLEALIVRARVRPPDPELARDLLAAIGSPGEPVALGLLADAGIDDPAALAVRRGELARLARLAPLLRTGGAADRDGTAAILAGRLVASAVAADGTVRFAEGPLPTLPAGVAIAGAGKPPPDLVAETLAVGEPLAGVSLVATVPRAAVRANANRSTAELAAALVALLLAGAAALLLTVRAARREATAARAKAAFVTRVGHDLRTPLALIRMYAETLAAGKVEDPAQAREFAGIAARESERLSGLVGQVLDLSRVGESELARRELDLSALAREVAEAHRPLVERAGMRLSVRSGPPVPVRGDPAALRGALANLIENAIRHAAAGGELAVECVDGGGTARLAVADRGPGVPGEIEDSLFERFVRGPGATVPGAGLGLAFVREVARAHGGEATAAPREGGGAVFAIRLPREGGTA